MCKNNSRDSCKFKVYSPLQLSCNLTGKYHAVGYYSHTHRWAQVRIRAGINFERLNKNRYD